jgi:tetratricopeptide (TPR) repeat protein
MANLADLRQPEEEREGPWSFDLSQLMSFEVLQRLTQVVADRKLAQGAWRDRVRDLLKQQPWLEPLLGVALRYGDPVCRQLFCDLAIASGLPEWIDQVKAFVSGQEGAYRGRVKTAVALANAGLLPAGLMRVWTGREWREVFMLAFDIYRDAVETYPRAARRLAEDGFYALQEGDAEQAEKLLRQALHKAPDNPSLMNNLAAALLQLDRKPEADELLQSISERFPDYFFGKTSRAHRLVGQQRLADAEELLNSLMRQNRLHVSEFTALAAAYIRLLVAQRKYDGAQSWLGMWERVEPDDPQLVQYRALVRSNPLARLGRMLFGRNR